MACFKPLHGIRMPQYLAPGVPNPRAGQYLVYSYMEHREPYLDPYTGEYIEEITIGCGKCVGCFLDKSREWAVRISCEASEYPEESNWFATLTYANAGDALRRPTFNDDDAMVLDKTHPTLWFKSIREGYNRYFGDMPDFNADVGLRYYLAGEYGDHSYRPHYHVCMLNFPLPDVELIGRTATGNQLFRSPYLDRKWQRGHITLGRLTYKSAAYAARYCMKKANGLTSAQYESIGLEPEYTVMSRRPGIGYHYINENGARIYSTDSVVLPSTRGKSANANKPPKYFDDKYALIDPSAVAKAKAKRAEVAEIMRDLKLSETDLDEIDYMDLQERTINERAKKLIRQFSDIS